MMTKVKYWGIYADDISGDVPHVSLKLTPTKDGVKYI